jgi:HEAT repeat protein
MAFLIRNLDHPDPMVQQDITACVARALDKYIHDDRAYEPMTRMTAAKSVVTRMWAIEGLAALTDDFVPWALQLVNDKSPRVREAAYVALGFSLRGGGTLNRPPLGAEGRRLIREAFVVYDLTAPADERASRAIQLCEIAEPAQLPVLQEWFKKEKSKGVREQLQRGIDRLMPKEAK